MNKLLYKTEILIQRPRSTQHSSIIKELMTIDQNINVSYPMSLASGRCYVVSKTYKNFSHKLLAFQCNKRTMTTTFARADHTIKEFNATKA